MAAKFRLIRPSGLVWDWIINLFFRERLGLDYLEIVSEVPNISLEHDGSVLTFPAYSAQLMAEWKVGAGSNSHIETRKLDSQTCSIWPAKAEALPVFANVVPAINVNSSTVCFNFDPLSLPVLLLSGAEEIIDPTRDSHDRYPAFRSVAFREGWLDRPVVDETVRLLRILINHLWSNAAIKPKPGRILVSCDVDQPFTPNLHQPYPYIRTIGGDLINRRDPKLAVCRALSGFMTSLGFQQFDISDTFERYMCILERYGLRGQFFFISGHSAANIDGFYQLHQPRIRSLLAQIIARGHSVGMHGSYNTFRNPRQIAIERLNLIQALENISVDQDDNQRDEHSLNNRQHFLRWDMSKTPDYLDSAGFTFDSSGSYPDAAGFRYGTAHDFSMWSWMQSRALKLRQRPLIAMECSIIAERYMGLGYGVEAYNTFKRLQDRAIAHGGTFTLLWHNNHFTKKADWLLFEYLVKRGAQIAKEGVTP